MLCPYQTSNCRQAQDLRSRWFSFAKENREKIKPRHAALFFYFLERYQSEGKEKVFELNTSEAMAMMGISSRNTYKKTLDELAGFGFITIVRKAENQHNKMTTLSFEALLEQRTGESIIQPSATQTEEIGTSSPTFFPSALQTGEANGSEKTPFKEEFSIDGEHTISDKEFKKICGTIVEDFARLCPQLKSMKYLTRDRRQQLHARLKEIGSYETLLTIFRRMDHSPWLRGKNPDRWVADFDWLIKNEKNWVKVIEGKYDNREPLPPPGTSASPASLQTSRFKNTILPTSSG